ncbi:MAG: hypothetical protein GY750_08255 [Lentisphaerae bacterium]|nr:hypothetical protein [Lentisphaerota bacterium]MCP4101401.1 hypothetical protein [Lentisphaerota bacterium]
MKVYDKYLLLEKHFNDFSARRINQLEFKHTLNKFGIKQQRNDKFMVRIRIPGGNIPTQQFRDIAVAASKHRVGYIHFSTRQTIQIRDVQAEQMIPLLKTITNYRIPFVGGCNNFNNIIASPDSGIGEDTIFDVMPFVHNLTQIMFNWDESLKLPRKMKLGFFSSAKDEYMATLQDLGFIAVENNGQRGFKVYSGGGMGRKVGNWNVAF